MLFDKEKIFRKLGTVSLTPAIVEFVPDIEAAVYISNLTKIDFDIEQPNLASAIEIFTRNLGTYSYTPIEEIFIHLLSAIYKTCLCSALDVNP